MFKIKIFSIKPLLLNPPLTAAIQFGLKSLINSGVLNISLVSFGRDESPKSLHGISALFSQDYCHYYDYLFADLLLQGNYNR